jgi:hypothetical protein
VVPLQRSLENRLALSTMSLKFVALAKMPIVDSAMTDRGAKLHDW